jgi:FkbM family methyltransferase
MIPYNLSRNEVEKAQGFVLDVTEDAVLMSCLDDYYIWGLKEDVSLTPSIMYNGHWEAWITSWFTNNIKAGDFVLDVGANIGYYTILFERLVGGLGGVWAYECNPTLLTLLERTLAYNNAQTHLFYKAVSDTVGEATLTFPGHYTGSASLTADFDPKYGEHTKMTVQTTTLDHEFEFARNLPDLIKLDIEGAEELAWNGMRRVLFDGPRAPVVVLEYTPGAYTKHFDREFLTSGIVTGIGYDGKEHPVDQAFLDGLTDWYMLVWRRR